ncbi:MAG: FAD-dependent oxidoreductase, partial [Actinobacteria bacterium]|nr:FAD-dependent oxidoreductase [Actinomycetota bacterium]
ASFKTDLVPLLDHLVAQVGKLRVTVIEQEAAAADLAGFDEVVVATGATRGAIELGPALPAVHATDALAGAALPGGEVVVVGGGFTGAETAIHLAESGRTVTLVEATDTLMNGDAFTDQMTYGERLAASGVTVLTGTRATATTAEGVAVVDAGGAARVLPAGVVIVAVGSACNTSLADALTGTVAVRAVGDCTGSGKLYDALHQAYTAALAV